jgi:hypothetical protein
VLITRVNAYLGMGKPVEGGHGMTWPKQKKAQDQRRKRHQRNERTFLFTPEGQLLGEVEGVPWEEALAEWGGDVVKAAMACGLANVPRSTKALWGRSAEAAWSTYRRWQKQRQRA